MAKSLSTADEIESWAHVRAAWAVVVVAAVDKAPLLAEAAAAAMAGSAYLRSTLDLPSAGVQATVAMSCLIAPSRQAYAN